MLINNRTTEVLSIAISSMHTLVVVVLLAVYYT